MYFVDLYLILRLERHERIMGVYHMDIEQRLAKGGVEYRTVTNLPISTRVPVVIPVVAWLRILSAQFAKLPTPVLSMLGGILLQCLHSCFIQVPYSFLMSDPLTFADFLPSLGPLRTRGLICLVLYVRGRLVILPGAFLILYVCGRLVGLPGGALCFGRGIGIPSPSSYPCCFVRACGDCVSV